MTDATTHAAATRTRRRRPDHMVLLVVGLAVATLTVNAIMLWVAFRDPAELVRRDYYDAAKQYDRVVQARAASEATGWRLGVQPPLARDAGVVLQVRNRHGEGITGLQGSVTAYRPDKRALDQQLRLNADGGEPGRYVARFAEPVPGVWQLTVDLERADGAGPGPQRLYRETRIVIP